MLRLGDLLNIEVVNADCLVALRELEDCSVDAIVTDPPYGLSNTKPAQVADVLKAWATGDDNVVPEGKGFMGKSWDGFVPPPAVWKECMRVLKPGGHMAVFAGARTQDLMGLSIRLAGFEIREGMGWIFGTGFPKSMDISKAIDKKAGAERAIIAEMPPSYAGMMKRDHQAAHGKRPEGQPWGNEGRPVTVTAPATDEAKQWDGWGTALKPAIEPIILARKPLVGTVAGNVLAYGVGGLNIDASRVPSNEITGWGGRGHASGGASLNLSVTGSADGQPNAVQGRFPANVLLDEHAAAEMDKQSGNRPGFATQRDLKASKKATGENIYGDWDGTSPGVREGYNDSGGASRFFPVFKYQAKAPKRERPVIEREDGSKIQHPTVKPVALMEWLVSLITPPGGTVLDPFAGSGTTLEAARNKSFHAIGIEREADYIALINKRLGNNND